MQRPDADHPGVIVAPPVLYAVALIITAALEWWLPLALAGNGWAFWVGAALLAAGLAFNLWGVYSLWRHGTAVHPTHPAERIVATGPFRLSRNPLYVGLHAAFVGVALILDTVWGLIVLVPLLLVMHYGVIRREEAHLQARFGDAYAAYRARVRRYL